MATKIIPTSDIEDFVWLSKDSRKKIDLAPRGIRWVTLLEQQVIVENTIAQCEGHITPYALSLFRNELAKLSSQRKNSMPRLRS
jgi:hypothetical protein